MNISVAYQTTYLVFSIHIFTDGLSVSFTSNFSSQQPLPEAVGDTSGVDETMLESTIKLQKNHSYVSQSAVALRCRVMPPPCIKNPYLKDASETDIDPFGNRRSKCAGIGVHLHISFDSFTMRKSCSLTEISNCL